jgi:hypothetical protein
VPAGPAGPGWRRAAPSDPGGRGAVAPETASAPGLRCYRRGCGKRAPPRGWGAWPVRRAGGTRSRLRQGRGRVRLRLSPPTCCLLSFLAVPFCICISSLSPLLCVCLLSSLYIFSPLLFCLLSSTPTFALSLSPLPIPAGHRASPSLYSSIFCTQSSDCRSLAKNQALALQFGEGPWVGDCTVGGVSQAHTLPRVWNLLTVRLPTPPVALGKRFGEGSFGFHP